MECEIKEMKNAGHVDGKDDGRKWAGQEESGGQRWLHCEDSKRRGNMLYNLGTHLERKVGRISLVHSTICEK